MDMNNNLQNLQQQGMISPQVAQQMAQIQPPVMPQQNPLQPGEGQVMSVEAKMNGANAKGEPYQKYSIKVADAMQQGRTLTYSKFAKLINGQWEVMPQMGQYIEFAYSIKPNPRSAQYPYKTIMKWSVKQNTPQLQTPQMPVQNVPIAPQVGFPIAPQPQNTPMPQGTYQNQGNQILQIPEMDIKAFKNSYLMVAKEKGITPEINHFIGTYVKNMMSNDPVVLKMIQEFTQG